MPQKKNVRQGPIELDYEEVALVIHYELEILEVDERGREVEVLERKSEQRRVKIKNLEGRDLGQMALDIIDKCKYIHPSRADELEQLLTKLRRAVSAPAEEKRDSAADNQPSAAAAAAAAARGSRERKDRAAAPADPDLVEDDDVDEPDEQLPPANISEIDDYMDMLYQVSGKGDKEKVEAIRVQIRGTGMILKLCRDVMNLEVLIQNTIVMGALTRVLQEEFKRSTALTFNIMRIFLAFSNFLEMHGLLASHRVGMLTLKAVDFEMRRFQHRQAERAAKEAEREEQVARIRADRGKSGDEKEAALLRVERAREREAKRSARMSVKQGKVLFVEFYVLFNLAEDVTVERKMVKKDLLPQLGAMLEHSYGDLLILCTAFLKKVCIYEENKDAAAASGLVRSLLRLVPCSSQPLVQSSLQLLFNLSFDGPLRRQMVDCGLVPRLVELLKQAPYRARVLRLLYNLSQDDRCKQALSETEGMALLMGLALNFPQPLLTLELAALLVNATHCSRNVEQLLANRGLNHLMDRLDTNPTDQGLLKIIRNVAYWTFRQQQLLDSPEAQYNYRGLWSPHFKQLLELATDTDNHDLLLEVLGTLACMTAQDVPANTSWARMLKEYQLVPLFSKLLVPGMAQADLQLELVMLIYTIAADPAACDLIASSNLIGLLYQLWKEKGDDDEILLQLVALFHRLFQRESTREEAMYSTRIVVDMLECLAHPNPAVRQAADVATELVLELDRREDGELGQLGAQIRKKRFEGYNQQWLASASSSAGGGGAAVSARETDFDALSQSLKGDTTNWRAMLNPKERLQLDMGNLDGGSDDEGESWEESGGDWN